MWAIVPACNDYKYISDDELPDQRDTDVIFFFYLSFIHRPDLVSTSPCFVLQ